MARDDGTNPYEGNSTMKGIEEVTLFWVDQNGCGTTPVVAQVPDIDASDNAVAEHYLYTGGTNGHTVELFKVIGGGHTWPGSLYPGSTGNTCMDFDARVEVWRFFSQYGLPITTSLEDHGAEGVDVWPNPTCGNVHIRSGDHAVTGVSIMDMQGRLLEEHAMGSIQHVDLGHLKAGTYLAGILVNGSYVVRKLVVSPTD